MSDSQVAIAVSIVALLGQVANVWLKRSMTGELAAFRTDLLDRIDGKYLPRETFETWRDALMGHTG